MQQTQRDLQQTQRDLQQTLRDLPRVGALVKDRGFRQVWRFEHAGRPYYLKFYKRGGFRDGWRRAFRGSPAGNEFARLQALQKAGIRAPRAVAVLMGFRIEGAGGAIVGDAVVLEALEPSIALGQLLADRELSGQPVPEHRDLAIQLIDLVRQLGKAGLGHDDLHLDNFLLHDGKLYLIDAYAVRRGGLRQADVLKLGASVARYATRTDVLRGWRRLAGFGRPPDANPVAARLWRELRDRAGGDNRYFGRLRLGEWRGTFFRQTRHPRPWSEASRLNVAAEDWESAWPRLLLQLEADSLPVLKRTPSGDVLAAQASLGNADVKLVCKRPRRRYWYRYFNEIPRGSRSRREWFKAWDLVVRDLPTAWPMALFEKRSMGYVVDSVILFERVAGPTLWTINLDALDEDARDRLFRRAGRVLRQIERVGFSHFDAKASNWIVRSDPARGPSPVLIDVDGIRRRRWIALGIDRLLRSMRDKVQYTPADSLALCQGYAPFTRLLRESGPEDETPGDEGDVVEEEAKNIADQD